MVCHLTCRKYCKEHVQYEERQKLARMRRIQERSEVRQLVFPSFQELLSMSVEGEEQNN